VKRSVRTAPATLAVAAAACGLALLVWVCAAPAGLAGARASGASGLAAEFRAADDSPRAGDTSGKDWRHSVQIVANLRARPPETPVVILLGGSSARECIVDEKSWAAQVRHLGGPTALTYDLASKHRTYSLDLGFARLLPRKVPAIVYIGVNLGRFCSSPTSTYVRLPSARFPPPTYRQHVYSILRHVESASTKRAYVQYWMQSRYPDFRANYGRALGVLARIIRTCLQRGLHPVLLDLPRDTAAIGSSFAVPVGMYHTGCRRLAAKYDIPFVDFVRAAHFADRDFYDVFHTVEPGRVKYQRLLASTTVRLLRRYDLHDPVEPTPTPTPTPTASPAP
jgi:hypothetical protein